MLSLFQLSACCNVDGSRPEEFQLQGAKHSHEEEPLGITHKDAQWEFRIKFIHSWCKQEQSHCY